MIVYVDTSAAVKLAVAESESTELREWIGRELAGGTNVVASQLTRAELIRTGRRIEGADQACRAVAAAFETVHLTPEDYAVAAELSPVETRTLDALHVAVALRVGADAILTYDERQSRAAAAAGLPVVAPR